MSVVMPHENWGPAISPADVKILDDDGEVGRMFSPGDAEVTIVGPITDRLHSRFVLPLAFPSLNQARDAGKILNEALERVRNIASHVPDQDECRHDFSLARFGRVLGKTAVCSKCSYAVQLPQVGKDHSRG